MSNILKKVKRLKELSAKATKGPWTKSGTDIIKTTGQNENEYLAICTHSMCSAPEQNIQLNVESRNAIDDLCICVGEMSEVLEYYGSETNWRAVGVLIDMKSRPIILDEIIEVARDRGKKARAVLEKWVGK